MKKKILILLITIGIFNGCSTKSNFYQLHPKNVQENIGVQSKKSTVIGIAEVEVSEYLKKSEIVTRMSAGRLNVHHDDVWAGSLSKNIQSVIRHNLTGLLPRYTFLSYPWEEPIDDRYRIYVTIDRFDAFETGQAALQGRWTLVNKEENRVLYGESVNYRAEGGKKLDEIVDTQSKLIDMLSRRIAQKIRIRL